MGYLAKYKPINIKKAPVQYNPAIELSTYVAILISKIPAKIKKSSMFFKIISIILFNFVHLLT